MIQRVLITEAKLVATIEHIPSIGIRLQNINDATVRKSRYLSTAHDIEVKYLDCDPYGPCRLASDRLILSAFATYLDWQKCQHRIANDTQNMDRFLRFFIDRRRAAFAVWAASHVVTDTPPSTPDVRRVIRGLALGELATLAATGLAYGDSRSRMIHLPDVTGLVSG